MWKSHIFNLRFSELCPLQTPRYLLLLPFSPQGNSRQFPRKNVLELFMLSCSLCFPLCFTSEMKHALPTSGSKSTFIFASLSFSVLGSATWSLSLGTAAYRKWIPFTDMLGMAYLMGEITAAPEVSVPVLSLFPSCLSRGGFNASLLSKEVELCVRADSGNSCFAV